MASCLRVAPVAPESFHCMLSPYRCVANLRRFGRRPHPRPAREAFPINSCQPTIPESISVVVRTARAHAAPSTSLPSWFGSTRSAGNCRSADLYDNLMTMSIDSRPVSSVGKRLTVSRGCPISWQHCCRRRSNAARSRPATGSPPNSSSRSTHGVSRTVVREAVHQLKIARAAACRARVRACSSRPPRSTSRWHSIPACSIR